VLNTLHLTTQSRGPPWKHGIQASYHPARRSLILVVRPYSMTLKSHRYQTLVAARKACSRCNTLVNPSAYPELDSDDIGPFSKWQGNLNSEIVVVGQDSSDIVTYTDRGGDWPGSAVHTNVVLVELLRAAGIDILLPQKGQSQDRFFFTNAVLCLKQARASGGRSMQGSIKNVYARNCGSLFLRPLIELIQPRAVVTLGSTALTATLASFGILKPAQLVNIVERGQTFELSPSCVLFPMCHPSRTVLNTVRSLDLQMKDWQALGIWLRSNYAIKGTSVETLDSSESPSGASVPYFGC